MTKDRILSFARELHALVSQAQQAQASIDQLNANITLAESMSDDKQVAELLKQKTKFREFVEKATAAAQTKANRSDLLAAERLLKEIEVRLQQHQELETTYLSMQATFELAAQMGEFDEGVEGTTRAEAEEKLSIAKQRMEAALNQAADLIPNKPVVLSL